MNTLLHAVIVVLAMASVGCRRTPATPPPTPPPPVQAPNAAPLGTAANPGNAAEMAFSSASVLTLMLQEYESANKRLPTSLKELESIKTYGPVPPTPPGFRFVIDPKRKQVVAVKQ